MSEEIIEIRLKHGLSTIIDASDVALIKGFDWYAILDNRGNRYYVVAHTGYHKQGQIRMHRLIMGATGRDYVDHKDHDTLNNRRSNLRLCSSSLNQANQVIRKDNRTGYKGVSVAGERFKATITVNGHIIYLGRYDTPELAAEAYDAAAVKYFGGFALTNAELRVSLYRAENVL